MAASLPPLVVGELGITSVLYDRSALICHKPPLKAFQDCVFIPQLRPLKSNGLALASLIKRREATP